MSEIKTIEILKFSQGVFSPMTDQVAVEEPLEFSLLYFEKEVEQTQSVSITMRTTGNDLELGLGFLFTEGILKSYDEVESISQIESNKILIKLKKSSQVELNKLKRNFYTTSSCGICGKSSLEAVRTISSVKNESSKTLNISSDIILNLKYKLNSHQSNFQQTGGIHASVLFDLYGNFQSIYEDVGRHNALDKLIGSYLMQNISTLSDYILLLSGRASFELIQKAAMAHILIVCAIGAPSSLAIELADEMGITLIGFLKADSFNVYTHTQRIIN